MSKYLNQAMKEEIISNIKLSAQIKADKSELGKELADLVKQAIAATRKVVKKECSLSELRILKKFEHTQKIGSIYYRLYEHSDGRKEITTNYLYTTAFKKEISFKPEIVVPKIDNWLRNVIMADTDLHDMYIKVYELAELLDCEIVKVARAYEKVMHNVRTVKSLLKKQPGMKKYLPADIKEDLTEEVLIRTFEES